MLFVLVFTGLVTHLGDPVRLTAYALGVAGGTLLGLLADERFSTGNSEVRMVVPGDGSALVDRLHRAGWPATWAHVHGPEGPATSAFVVVDDRRVEEVLTSLDGLTLPPFVTVERLRQAYPVALPVGFVQVGDRPTRRQRAGRTRGLRSRATRSQATGRRVDRRGFAGGEWARHRRWPLSYSHGRAGRRAGGRMKVPS